MHMLQRANVPARVRVPVNSAHARGGVVDAAAASRDAGVQAAERRARPPGVRGVAVRIPAAVLARADVRFAVLLRCTRAKREEEQLQARATHPALAR